MYACRYCANVHNPQSFTESIIMFSLLYSTKSPSYHIFAGLCAVSPPFPLMPYIPSILSNLYSWVFHFHLSFFRCASSPSPIRILLFKHPLSPVSPLSCLSSPPLHFFFSPAHCTTFSSSSLLPPMPFLSHFLFVALPFTIVSTIPVLPVWLSFLPQL